MCSNDYCKELGKLQKDINSVLLWNYGIKPITFLKTYTITNSKKNKDNKNDK